ncbi:hypothetical protein BDV32DRAFT_142943 [Aspergillus pseudonomiae]|uniref:Uncharacterized protein n=1 Tax=Aspergillus pseudonomiae TaxID=1506151 RepID=A0A5N6HKR0_9EURO|nr:uncharacterized protein BDV37DRAFT_275529 [Aspergillus pseudonomiae]KAB8254377.1 hypothetical protein BDV32DRAFT_142943 [Aspergillus pseudonomiae]KAE8399122.1 hypothetical protein BDV37DRAFT_275529 [Aspergillus pseudonomiae]
MQLSAPENCGVTPHIEIPYRIDKVVEHSQDSAPASILLANDTCQVSEFISLFNVGFSTLVHDDPPSIYKYPTLKKSDLQSLSRIAPSVFSLRYREAMQRFAASEIHRNQRKHRREHPIPRRLGHRRNTNIRLLSRHKWRY